MISKSSARRGHEDLPASAEPALFAGSGEMSALCRAFDWATTSLGPPATWSTSLRTTVMTLLESRHPMFLWWGADLVQIYNDGYRPSLAEGGRHPRALGMRGRDFWTEIWHIIGPQIEGVMTRGEATWHEDHLVPIERNGRIEDVYWTYGYSPVRDDDLSIGGTLVVCQETTLQVLRRASEARTYIDPSVADLIVDGRPDSNADTDPPAAALPLSNREREVLMRIAKGYSNKEIAYELHLSVKTIETYKSRMADKLGLKSRIDIVKYALTQGWLGDS